MAKRFTVHTVTGYATAMVGTSRSSPGLTAYVVDAANGREVAAYRSEDAPNWTNDRKQWALNQARDYARGAEANGQV